MIIIKEVLTKRDRKAFATYPLKLYKNNPFYVPTIRADELNTFNPNKNASLSYQTAKGFLAYKNGELVGRIAGIINPKDNDIQKKKFIRFSRLECINDIEVFKALIGAVEKMGKEHGMELIHGPWGFNDTDREGMLTFGFDKRSTYATNYYYPYFCENVRALDFETESKWIERRIFLPEKPIERIVNIAEKIKKRHELVDIAETMSVKEIIKNYGKELFDTYNDAYSVLDGFVRVTDEEVKDILKSFASIVNPRYISVLVDKNNKVVSFGIVLSSICDAIKKSKGKLFPFGFIGLLKSINHPKELELALIGVADNYKNSGVHSIMISRIMKNIIEDGITFVESNPMLEHNHSIQHLWDHFDTEVIKKRETFIKKID